MKSSIFWFISFLQLLIMVLMKSYQDKKSVALHAEQLIVVLALAADKHSLKNDEKF